MESCLSKRQHHLSPTVGQFWKAMKEQYTRTVFDLKASLQLWHERNHAGRPPSVKALTNRLANQGLLKEKRGGARGWRRLTLKEEFCHELNSAR